MDKNIDEKQVTVEWIMVEDGLIKFEEENDAYDISDAVISFFEKREPKEGTFADVKIDLDQGDCGTLVYFKPSNSKKSTSKPKQNSNSGTSSDKKVAVLDVVSAKNKAVKFENEDAWYYLTGKLKEYDTNKLGIVKGAKVEANVEKEPEGKTNGEINYIEVLERSNNKSGYSKGNNKTNNSYKNSRGTSDQQTSIEAQCAVNRACDLVGVFLKDADMSNPEDGKKVKSAITVLAKHNYDVIQEIKNSTKE